MIPKIDRGLLLSFIFFLMLESYTTFMIYSNIKICEVTEMLEFMKDNVLPQFLVLNFLSRLFIPRSWRLR